MSILPSSLGATASGYPVTPGGPAAPARGAGFANVWASVAPGKGSASVEVQRGDTLIGLVKAHYRQQGLPIGEGQAFRLAHQVAADNGIANPDRILVGQRIAFDRLGLPALARAAPTPWEQPLATSTESALAARQWGTPTPVPERLQAGTALLATSATAPSVSSAGGEHPVLEQTLSRAVGKGYLKEAELPAVRSRILALSERYRFAPDDFARLSLMESGGLNPQASNGHCHGIIQFCDGPARGAASVGYRDNPRAILGLNMLQQLDLVDRYFAQVGLGQDSAKSGPPMGLDDLYLSVLTPAARSERRPDAALGIAGPQASYLHVDRDRQKPITRNSILQGLYAYTNTVLQGALAARAGHRPSAPQFAQGALDKPDADTTTR